MLVNNLSYIQCPSLIDKYQFENGELIIVIIHKSNLEYFNFKINVYEKT